MTRSELLRTIMMTRFGWRVLILCSSLLATILGLLGPFLQKSYLDLLLHNSTIANLGFAWNPDLPPWILMVYSFFTVLGYLGFSLLTSYLGSREAVIMQGILGRKLYDKTLILRPESLNGKAVGEFVSVYATDVPGATILLEQTLPQGAGIFFPLILAPWALHYFFGVPMIHMLVIMGSIGVLNFFMAARQSRYFAQFKQLAAERIGIVAEWVQNIRTLRILGWVDSFEQRIFATRVNETVNRVTMVTNGQVMNSFASSITFILNIAVLTSLVFSTNQPVTSGTLFALLWIVAIFLTRPFRQMPWVFTFIFDGWTSLTRLVDFFNLANVDEHQRKEEFQKIPEMGPQSPILRVKNLNLSIGGQEILKSLDLEVNRGEFVAIVGEVGSGKSMLLMSLLGETGARFQEYSLHGANALEMPIEQVRQFFTFVPQEGFIMSASLRDNVAFDYSISHGEDSKILQSLRLAQFDLAVERVTDGLDTEIGERGINLSGGQRQRVSLARVDLYASPIVLMDDCLSAVDVETEDKLIESLLKGSWKDRTRILVTHRLTVLDEVDRVIFIENGRKVAEGTFHDLLRTQPKFQTFAATVAAQATANKTQEVVNSLNATMVTEVPTVLSSEEGSDG